MITVPEIVYLTFLLDVVTISSSTSCTFAPLKMEFYSEYSHSEVNKLNFLIHQFFGVT